MTDSPSPAQEPHDIAPAPPATAAAPAAGPTALANPPIPAPSPEDRLAVFLRRSAFKEASEQIQQQAWMDALIEEFRPQGPKELAWVRDIAVHQVNIDRMRRAQATGIALGRERAAREIVHPGFHHFEPGAPGYRPTECAYEEFMGYGRQVERWSPEEQVAAAKAELAAHGIGEAGLVDIAVGLELPTIERSEKLIAGWEARRNRAYEDLRQSVERRERLRQPPAIDGEFVER